MKSRYIDLLNLTMIHKKQAQKKATRNM